MKKALAHVAAARPARVPFTLPVRLGSGLALLALVGGLGLFAARPAHTAGGPVPVAVSNLPLPTTDADNPGRAPFGTRLTLTIKPDQGRGYASQSFTVPAHKRLTLTYVSADCVVGPGVASLVGIDTTVNGGLVESYLALTPQGKILGGNISVSSGPVTLYADGGTDVTIFVTDTDGSGTGGLNVGLYGSLVDAP